MVPRASLNGCGKSRPKLGFYIQTAQLVASHSTDYATLAQRLHIYEYIYIYIYLFIYIYIYSFSCCVVFLLGLRKVSQHAWCLSLSGLLTHSDYSIFVKLIFKAMPLETFA